MQRPCRVYPLLVQTYRDAPGRPDATLWYGPFEGRWAIPVALFGIGALLLLVALEAERRSFRSLACTRPGVCTVERGSGLLGVRVAETFAPDTIVDVRGHRTTGKTSRRTLVLVRSGGTELVLAEGSVVPELLAQTQPFFTSKRAESLTVRAPASAEDWMIAGAASLAALLAGAWAARSSLRAAVRVRVEVLHGEGVVRVARGRSPSVDVPIADIGGVEVAHEGTSGAGAARVCLIRRTNPDVPLLDRFVRGGTAHASLAAELRSELGLPG